MPVTRGTLDRRPDWLQHKHTRQPADPRLAAWADEVIAVLADQRHAPRHVPLGRTCADEAISRARKNALYTARHRHRTGTRMSSPGWITIR